MYDKRILAAGFGASLGVVALVALLVVSSGTAYAVPMAGVGGFTVEADEIRGEGMFIYPDSEETSEQDAAPVATTELQNSEIEGLTLTKKMNADPMPGLSGTIVVQISSTETVETGEQMLKYSQLRADESEFSGQVINEYNEDDPSDQFGIGAPSDEIQEGKTIDIEGEEPGLVLRNAEIQSHYLAVESISIPDLEFDVYMEEDGGDGGDEADGDDDSGNESTEHADDGTETDGNETDE